MICEPRFESLLGTEGFFSQARFQVTFCSHFCVEIEMPGLLKQGFRRECIAKASFSQELKSGDIKLHFLCFLGRHFF